MAVPGCAGSPQPLGQKGSWWWSPITSTFLDPGREAALAWASLAQRFPASSVLAREGAGCGSAGDVTGAWLASAPLWPSLWT